MSTIATDTSITPERSEMTNRMREHDFVERLGGAAVTIALSIIFLWFGFLKFTDYEASGVAGFIINSPLISWLHGTFGTAGGAKFLGFFEIVTGLLIAARLFSPRLGVVGGAMGAFTFFVTLTLLLSTPGVIQPGHNGPFFLSAVPGQFLLKDLGLFAACLWILGRSLTELKARRAG